MDSMFKNTMKLTHFILRKERIFIFVWIGALLMIAGVMLVTFENQFTVEELQGLLIMKENPAHIAVQGPFFEANIFLTGHFFAVEMHLFTLIAVSILNIFFVMQNTRSDEEKGRYELLRSLPIGRLSTIHATMISAVIVNILLAVSHGILFSVLNISGITTAGAFTYGATLGVTGIFFAALSALLSQFSHSTRAVTGYAFIVLIASYLLRAVGDVTSEPLSLISPLGLPLRTETFVSNSMWPLLIMLLMALVICAIAYFLNARRDIGQGLLPDKQGKNYASVFLRTPPGLVWRQNRNTLFSWAIGLFAFGAAMGGILRDAEHFAGENAAFQMLLPISADFSTVELFTVFINVSFAIICIAPVFILIFKALREEKEGRTEPILSGAISRPHYLSGFIMLAFAASLLMPFVISLGYWFVSSLMLDDPLKFDTTIESMMVYVPAIWTMLGLGIFIIGVFPKAAMLCWAYFTYIFIVGFFGELLNIPTWAMNLSPFEFIPQLPLEEVNIATLLILTAAALALTVLGLIFYRRRDCFTS